jgi:gliding motility-associated protein GldM
MASGKLSPRQKMINMMYLVLTAMLALNVSKDILLVLHKLDQGMTATVTTVAKGTENVYRSFEAQLQDNPRAAEPWEVAKEVRSQTDKVFGLLSKTRNDLIDLTGGIDEEEDGRLNGADNRDIPENYLLNDKSIGGQGAAKDIKAQLIAYRDYLLTVSSGNDNLINELNQAFDFKDVQQEGKKMTWETATFSELPLAGVIPFITDLQSRVRRMEANSIEYLYSSIDAATVKFDGVRAIVMPISTYVTQGGTYEADVFLAAYNSGNNPVFEGIVPASIENGVGKLTIPATGIGEKSLKGSMTLPGSETVYTYDVVYTVAPPMVVISPSKMNVLYRNVDNPLEISVPGVAPKDLIVSGPGVSGSNGNYSADVTKISGKEVVINVRVKESDGKTRNAGSKEFRIKGLPQAVGSVYKKSEGIMSSGLLSKATIEAEYQDFPFDLALKVVAFELKMDGQPPIQVQGNTIPSTARELITRLRPGSTVSVRKIVATTPKGQRVSNVGIISIDVQ